MRAQHQPCAGSKPCVQRACLAHWWVKGPVDSHNCCYQCAGQLRLTGRVWHSDDGTGPVGYGSKGVEVLEQFEVEDTRSPEEVVAMIRRAGYDPVWKDFDRAFRA